MSDEAADKESSETVKPGPSLFLSEICSYSDLSVPIKLSPGIYFTALTVSESYIWCGCNRSTLYVFDRLTLKHVYLIPTSSPSAGGVSHLAVYKTELLCASANRSGEVYIVGTKKSSSKQPESVEALKLSTTITSLVWHSDNTKLYISDDSGAIYICSILTSKIFPKTNLLTKLDSYVHHLDFRGTSLLASTLTKCILYHTDRKTWTDVGTKPRNGYFGAVLCLLDSSSDHDTQSVISYCARPGLRVWRTDSYGKVISTLSFRKNLTDCQVTQIHSRFGSLSNGSDYIATQSLPSGFSNLQIIRDDFLICCIERRIYVLDTRDSTVVQICHVPADISSSVAYENAQYILTSDGSVRCYELTTLPEYLEKILDTETISEVVTMCLNNQTEMRRYSMILHRVQEILTPDHEATQEFEKAFSATIEDYKSSLSSGKNSRSSTVSSVSSIQISGSHSSVTTSEINYTREGNSEIANTREDNSAGNTTHHTDDQTSQSSDQIDGATDCDRPSTDCAKAAADETVDLSTNDKVAEVGVEQDTPAEKQTDSERNDDDNETVKTADDALICTPISISASVSTMSRNDSSKSLVSMTSVGSSITTASTRRGSITSVSSFDQSEDYPVESCKKPRRRRVRAATITFTSPDKDGNESDDSLPKDYTSPPQPINPESRRVIVSRSLNKELSSSPRSLSGQELSASPRSLTHELSASPRIMELSSPGAMVDHVKDQVKDGLTRIGSQAKSLISVIKEKAASQATLERIMGHNKEELQDFGQSMTPGELSEDSGSHHGFFIGDDDLSMADVAPSSLAAYLELTEITHGRLSDPLVLFTPDIMIPLLEKWSAKLCLLLSEYSQSIQQSPDGRPCLRNISKVCPWRMSNELLSQSQYLATLCVLKHSCDCIQDYKITECDTTNQSYLLPWCYAINHLLNSEELTGTDSGLHSNQSSPVQTLTPYSQSSQEAILSDKPTEISSSHENDEKSAGTDREETGSNNESTRLPYHVLQSCQFMSTFWFLMDTSQLCGVIDQLSQSDTLLQHALWSTMINCLIESCSEKLDWRSVFSGGLLFNAVDMSKKLLKEDDQSGLWLYTYLLTRQQKLDRAVSVALDCQQHIPVCHVMMSLKSLIEYDEPEAELLCEKYFSKYIQSLIQYQESSTRASFLKKMMMHGDLFTFWLKCLDATAVDVTDQASYCKCGKPRVIERKIESSLHFNLYSIILLLEECYADNHQVQSLVRKLGGARAQLRQNIRLRNTEEVLKLLLISHHDLTLINETLGSMDLSTDDWKLLFSLRTAQQTDMTSSSSRSVICLWCGEIYTRDRAPIAWDTLAEIMLALVGAEKCVDILSETNLPVSSVTANFFSSCISVHQEQLKSRRLVGELIDSMESFLWSTELSEKNINPYLMSLAEQESAVYRSTKEGFHLNKSNTHQLTQKAEALRQLDSLRTIENGDIHWGAAVKLTQECYLCGMQLSQTNNHITVFSCGHAVHQPCLPSNRECQQCADNKLSNTTKRR